jgi:hypothetical protein
VESGVELPVVLLVDNHSSHVTWENIKLASDLGIKMLGLPPNTTVRISSAPRVVSELDSLKAFPHVFLLQAITQPLDLMVFQQVKAAWERLKTE